MGSEKGEKRKVGIFGGSFDPIHAGHVALARYALKHAHLDEVWLMISPRNPLKPQATVATNEERLEMAELATRGIDGLKVSNFEFSLPVPSYSWLTLTRLREEYPDILFQLIIGGDNWADFELWKNHDLIREEFGVIVYPRPGETIPTAPEGVKILEEAPRMPVSSTEIRAMLKSSDHQSAARLKEVLNMEVLQYIRQRHLYGTSHYGCSQ